MSSEDTVKSPVHEFEDEWIDELAPTSRRRLLTPLTAALAAAVLVGIGVFAGILIQKHYATSSTSASGVPAGLAGLTGGGGASAAGVGGSPTTGAALRGGVRPGGGFTSGQVSIIRGNIFYVQDQAGTTVKVKTTAATTVTKSSKVTVTAVYPGDTITIQGMKDKSGTLIADAINLGSGLGGLGTAPTSAAGTKKPAGKGTAGAKPAATDKFTTCLSRHGIKLSGGPGSGAGPSAGPGAGDLFSDPKIQAAMKACQRYAPAGGMTGPPGAAQGKG